MFVSWYTNVNSHHTTLIVTALFPFVHEALLSNGRVINAYEVTSRFVDYYCPYCHNKVFFNNGGYGKNPYFFHRPANPNCIYDRSGDEWGETNTHSSYTHSSYTHSSYTHSSYTHSSYTHSGSSYSVSDKELDEYLKNYKSTESATDYLTEILCYFVMLVIPGGGLLITANSSSQIGAVVSIILGIITFIVALLLLILGLTEHDYLLLFASVFVHFCGMGLAVVLDSL